MTNTRTAPPLTGKTFSTVLCQKHQGFTLVEMLVVITIITVLLTVGALGIKNLSKGAGVTAGVSTAEAVFSEARSIAVGRGTKARVLIHAQNDPSDPLHRERYLKYMAIAYEELSADGEPTGDWKIASRGTLLPNGVYFIKDLSETNAPGLSSPMTITLPGNSSSRCYYYEFNSEGLITDPQITGDDAPRFVIRTASLPPGRDEPVVDSDAEKNIGGFVIWRSGRTSVFRHPDQIQ